MPYTPITYGDSAIYRELDTAPTLPAAGGSFQDDTWGTRIYRVTDAGNAPDGSVTNSGSAHSHFNADGTMFYVNLGGSGNGDVHIISLSGTAPAALTLTDLGAVGLIQPGNWAVGFDGASWDWADPGTLYALGNDRFYSLYSIAIPSMAKTFLHDFRTDIPAANGYASTRLMLHPSNRYIAVMLSTFGGQDTAGYIVVWDQVANQTVATFDTEARLGAGVYLHGSLCDNSGEYILMTPVGDGCYVWHWRTDTLSDFITAPGAPDILDSHFSTGWGFVFGPTSNGASDPDWVWRSAAAMHKYTTLLSIPRKGGVKNWWDDSHSTRMLPPHRNHPAGPAYVASRLSPTYTWSATAGHANVYEVPNFYPNGIVNQPPDTCFYYGIAVPAATQIPTAPNQWWYDSGANIVYLWTTGNDDLTLSANAAKAFVFDYRVFTQEIYALEYVNGAVTWRRFAHTYSHLQDTGDYWAGSGAPASPDGRYVLFASRWGGASRIDTFLLVPTTPPSVAIAPVTIRRAGAFA